MTAPVSSERRSVADCPTCGAPVSPFVTKCPFCGADVARRSRWRARRLKLRSRLRRLRAPRTVGQGPGGRGRLGRHLRSPLSERAFEPHRPSETPYGAGALLVANIFAWLVFRSDSGPAAGALIGDEVRSGQFYRLLTYQFLHSDLLELVFALFLLLIFAVILEQRFGHLAVVAIYLVSGTVGAAAALAVSTERVLFGSLVSTLGLMAAWFVSDLIARRRYQSTYPWYAGLILIGVIFAVGALQDGIDAFALLAGLVAGGAMAAWYERAELSRR